MAVTYQLHRFTVDDYYQMGKTGILKEGDRVELLNGEIVEMSPIGSPHAGGVKRCNRTLSAALGDQAIIGVQDPVRLGDESEPIPDVAVLRPRADVYTESHPTPADILLILEVADTSVAFDRRIKLPLYAQHGIPETWLLVVGGTPRSRTGLEVHREPSSDGYKQVLRLNRGDRIATLAFPSVEIAVDDLLGSA